MTNNDPVVTVAEIENCQRGLLNCNILEAEMDRMKRCEIPVEDLERRCQHLKRFLTNYDQVYGPLAVQKKKR